MKMKFCFLVFVLCLTALPAFSAEISVKIDGDQEEASKFVTQLNENAKDYDLHFTLATTDYQYRIAMDAEGMTASDRLFGGGADAAAAVLDPNCSLLFIISRGGRATKGGAMNALSKEIDKKLAEHLGIQKK